MVNGNFNRNDCTWWRIDPHQLKQVVHIILGKRFTPVLYHHDMVSTNIIMALVPFDRLENQLEEAAVNISVFLRLSLT